MKKIAIVTPVFPPYRGGMANISFRHADILWRENYDVTVFTPKYSALSSGQKEKYGWKCIFLQPVFSYGNAAYVPELKKYLHKYSHIILHYPFFGGAEPCLSFKIQHPEKKLFTLYHMDPQGKGIKKVFFSLYQKYYLPRLLGASDKILITSEDYAEHSSLAPYFQKYREHFEVLPCGVDISHFSPMPSEREYFKRLGLGDFDFYILFVGGLDSAHYFKGVDILLKTVSTLKYNFALCIVGRGNRLPTYRRLAEKLGLAPRVFFFPEVTPGDLPKFYQCADVAVLPSINSAEAFGIVLLEASSCGKPVIASNLPGVRTVVESSITGILVRPKDSGDLADALESMFKNPSLAKKMGEEGRKRVEERYSWEKIKEKLLSILV